MINYTNRFNQVCRSEGNKIMKCKTCETETNLLLILEGLKICDDCRIEFGFNYPDIYAKGNAIIIPPFQAGNATVLERPRDDPARAVALLLRLSRPADQQECLGLPGVPGPRWTQA